MKTTTSGVPPPRSTRRKAGGPGFRESPFEGTTLSPPPAQRERSLYVYPFCRSRNAVSISESGYTRDWLEDYRD